MGVNPLLKMPAPRILLRQVKDTTPWLWPVPAELRAGGLRPAQLLGHPLGWWRILDAAASWNRLTRGDGTELSDYLALCLACHHASVASYVPTDVDSKIRGHLWRLASTPRQLEGLYGLLVESLSWDAAPCSRRMLPTPEGPISGHDGERLGCLVGAFGQLLRHGCDAAGDAAARIDAELARSVRIWQGEWEWPERCQLAAILTHNAGDVDQGRSYWPQAPGLAEAARRWGRLAHGGGADVEPTVAAAFTDAARWYRVGIAAEGHRNYPLREISSLRRHPDLLLPIAPFLEDWGRTLATHPCLNGEDRLDILGRLLHACFRVAQQRGYQRAIRGMLAAHPDPIWLCDRLPVAAAALLDHPEVAPLVAAEPEALRASLAPSPSM